MCRVHLCLLGCRFCSFPWCVGFVQRGVAVCVLRVPLWCQLCSSHLCPRQLSQRKSELWVLQWTHALGGGWGCWTSFDFPSLSPAWGCRMSFDFPFLSPAWGCQMSFDSPFLSPALGCQMSFFFSISSLGMSDVISLFCLQPGDVRCHFPFLSPARGCRMSFPFSVSFLGLLPSTVALCSFCVIHCWLVMLLTFPRSQIFSVDKYLFKKKKKCAALVEQLGDDSW